MFSLAALTGPGVDVAAAEIFIVLHGDVVPDNHLDTQGGKLGFGDTRVDQGLVPCRTVALLNDLGLSLGCLRSVGQ